MQNLNPLAKFVSVLLVSISPCCEKNTKDHLADMCSAHSWWFSIACWVWSDDHQW